MNGAEKKDKSGSSRIFTLTLLTLILSWRLLLPPALRAESQDFPDRINRQFFHRVLQDTGSMISSPLHWKRSDFWKAGLALSSIAACFPVDNSVHRLVLEHPDSTRDSVARVFSGAGKPEALLGLVAAGYLAGCLDRNDGLRRAFLLAGESLVITELVVQVAKTGIGRARPYNEEGAFSFHPLSFRKKYYSLPSGHSASAWALAASLAESSRSPYVDVLLYTLAAGISLSRICLDKHFISDVVAGGLLGFFIGKKLSRRPSARPQGLAFQFMVNRKLLAVGLNYQF